MFYIHSLKNLRHCPFCGKEIYNEKLVDVEPCEHIAMISTEETAFEDGILYLSNIIRQKYFPNYVKEYSSDGVLTLKIGREKIRRIMRENECVMLNVREFEGGYYEWPILKFVFFEPTEC